MILLYFYFRYILYSFIYLSILFLSFFMYLSTHLHSFIPSSCTHSSPPATPTLRVYVGGDDRETYSGPLRAAAVAKWIAEVMPARIENVKMDNFENFVKKGSEIMKVLLVSKMDHPTILYKALSRYIFFSFFLFCFVLFVCLFVCFILFLFCFIINKHQPILSLIVFIIFVELLFSFHFISFFFYVIVQLQIS